MELSFSGLATVMSILAFVAGAAILVGLKGKSLSGNLAWVLLGIWLILQGLAPFLNLRFTGLDLLMNLLALVAGYLMLVRR